MFKQVSDDLIEQMINDGKIKSVIGSGKKPTTGKTNKALEFITNFRITPLELINFLEPKVIKQKRAIRTLSTVVCNHYNLIRHRLEQGENPMGDIDMIKSNVLLIGPTGVGKTFLVKSIAKKIGVPFVRVDATKYTKAGYVGEDVEDIVRGLVEKTKGADGESDIDMAQYGIVFIDEIDKIRRSGSGGLDVGGESVQQALLTLIEDIDIKIKPTIKDVAKLLQTASKPDSRSLLPDVGVAEKMVNTRNILFIFSGSFSGLDEIVAKRVNNRATLGFNGDTKVNLSSAEVLNQIDTADLVEFGLIPEFIGRIPVRTTLDCFDENDLLNILQAPSPIITKFKKEIVAYNGTEVFFDEDVLRLIAKKAVKMQTGARGLLSVFNEVVGIYATYLPDIDIPKFVFTLPLVDGTYDPLEVIVKLKERIFLEKTKKDLQVYVDYIFSKYELKISFDEETILLINNKVQIEKITPFEICKKMFETIEDGFGLLVNKGKNNLVVSKEVFESPVAFLTNNFK